MRDNVLTALESLIHDQAKQATILDAMRLNVSVLMTGLRISPEQLHRYFYWLYDGICLAQKLLGNGAMPCNIVFIADPPPGFRPGFVGYWSETDTIYIDFVRVVRSASVASDDDLVWYEGFREVIRGKANTMLIVMEECFHRYQVCILKRDLPKDKSVGWNHPLEVEWRAFRDQLIQDGIVVCRPAHKA